MILPVVGARWLFACYNSEFNSSGLRIFFLGNVTEMNCSQFLTYGDVIKYFLFCKTKITNEYGGKNPSLSRICNQLASDIAAVYQRASVPTVSVQRIVKQLQMYHDKYQNIMRSYKSRSESAHLGKR